MNRSGDTPMLWRAELGGRGDEPGHPRQGASKE